MSETHHEDRFLDLPKAQAVCLDLEANGFKHVVAMRKTDPAWRRDYRAGRPELNGWMWSIRLDEYLTPMPRIKALIELCERHDLTFWMGSHPGDSEEGYGPELYLKIARGSSAQDRPGPR